MVTIEKLTGPFHRLKKVNRNHESQDDHNIQRQGARRKLINSTSHTMTRDDSDLGRKSRSVIRSVSPTRPSDRSRSVSNSKSLDIRQRKRRGTEDSEHNSSCDSKSASMIGRFFSRRKGETHTGALSHRSESTDHGDGSVDGPFNADRASMKVNSVSDLPRGILKTSQENHVARQSTSLGKDPTHMLYHAKLSFEQSAHDTTDAVEDMQYEFDKTLTDYAPRRSAGERARYSIYHGSVKRKFRVRPYHLFPVDFKMTEEEIYTDSMKPSQNFIFLKSYLAPTSNEIKMINPPMSVSQLFGSPLEDGRIGALRVEVLGCIALARSKPDIAVYMVCGDAAFATDVLSGYRSPIWPSLSRRAAVFPLHHAFAQLYVGVFDVRAKNKENDHFCGRVALDIAALRSDTEYDVTFPLRASSFVYDRRKRGVIRLRFSVHWFSERAALVSYFKKTKSLVCSSTLYHGNPTIPCADPKTFRNVAFTVYGQDLPGKYSRNAFKSTMREYTLYQQNLTLLAQMLALDAIFYERPHVSLYLLFAGMYCILSNSFSLVPAVLVGYIIIQFLENYMHYVDSTKFNMGYKPHTLQEILNGLLGNSAGAGGFFEPTIIEKKTKRKRGYEYDEQNDGNEVEIEPLDHREFPFSDRDAYPKWSIEDALAPSSNKKNAGGNTRLHGRLSVYYTAAPPVGGESTGGEDDNDSSEDSDNDDESMDTTDTMFNLDYDVDELDDQLIEQETLQNAYQHQGNLLEPTVTKTRLKVGPPQDVDRKGVKVPPQLQLQKAERRMHNWSLKIAVEPVFAPVDTGLDPTVWNNRSSKEENRELSTLTDQNAALKKRKAVYDEFDKLLGLKSRSANPLSRIMSSFLGPLMRMCRISLYAFRITYHTFSWRDPFLSFWVLVALCFIGLVLIAFPWRQFFFVVVAALLGPQNIFVRRYLEKKLKEKAIKALEEEEGVACDIKDSALQQRSSSTNEMFAPDDLRKSGWFTVSNKDKQKQRSEPEPDFVERPPFAPHHHLSASKKVQPRSVVIPYSRVKKDRFFDWPPDPTVSRATPLPFRTEFKSTPRALGRSESCDSTGSLGGSSNLGDDSLPRGLRRRPKPYVQSELPNLYL